MTDDGTLPDRLRNMVRNPNAIGTHSAACWQWHDDCALLLAADRVAERDADVSAGAVARTVAMSHIAAERDAERAARERAEAEARQLRQAVMEAATELGLAHEPEWASPAAKEKGLNPVWCAICGAADGSWPCTSRMVLDDLLAVVAEGAEDRAKFPGLHDRPDTGKECHYLAVTMPHGGLFCNKCGWAEGAEDRGQTHTQTEQPTET